MAYFCIFCRLRGEAVRQALVCFGTFNSTLWISALGRYVELSIATPMLRSKLCTDG
ncbi:hypothetical protein MIZ03_1490 [Rhodoferax lithotrophicus]|uniref:Uncharacterized protein n=1 Tax=Rhodoferax lithotrophicus TaxID=2798804 RepID=A0ABN6D3L9_9BURK|nr:hypothetical protein MIZ03_1490 [Rhodoferax sp. MIZ03]